MLIKAGANQYRLEYNMNSICDFEDITGLQVAYITKRSLSGLNTLRALFWAGLQEHQPDLKLKDAGNIIQDYLKSGKKMENLFNIIFNELEKLEFFEKDPKDHLPNNREKKRNNYHSRKNA